jgi:hypothetical protein
LDYLTTHTSLSPIWRGFRARLTAACDEAYQLLVHVWWFSLGTPASSTTKTVRHDIAEILLKMALNTRNHHQSTGITSKKKCADIRSHKPKAKEHKPKDKQ